MAKHRSKSPEEQTEPQNGAPSKKHHPHKSKTKPKPDPISESESEDDGFQKPEEKTTKADNKTKRKHTTRKPLKKRRYRSPDSYSSSSDSGESDSESSSEYSDSEEDRRRRRKRRERREKERKKRRREKEEDRKRKRKKKEKSKKREKEKGKKGAVTDSWGKYGIIRETDMWNKRPEFTAWLLDVKQVNLESLPNWEEKQMFKQFMEDHNTATFPSKKYYDLDAYYRLKIEKEMKKGSKKALDTERTVFNDEEQRRQELLHEREKQKEEQVEALKRSMQDGMAQAMKEQALLREEMSLQYKLGNFEAAAAIQKRLDPDVAM